jgi:hypothetical protein
MKSITYQQGLDTLRSKDSYSRLPTILDMHRSMRETVWLKLLGDSWTSCDNISIHAEYLRAILSGKFNARPMMTSSEWRHLNALPETVTIFRGCGSHNLSGLSWTTERTIAEKFPFLNRYRVRDPQLIIATVAKRDIVAFKNDRDESEVIALRPEVESIESLVAEVAT